MPMIEPDNGLGASRLLLGSWNVRLLLKSIGSVKQQFIISKIDRHIARSTPLRTGRNALPEHPRNTGFQQFVRRVDRDVRAPVLQASADIHPRTGRCKTNRRARKGIVFLSVPAPCHILRSIRDRPRRRHVSQHQKSSPYWSWSRHSRMAGRMHGCVAAA